MKKRILSLLLVLTLCVSLLSIHAWAFEIGGEFVDEEEPNNTIYTAQTILSNHDTYQGTIQGSSGDVDVYTFQLEEASHVRFPLYGKAETEFVLFNADLAQVARASYLGEDPDGFGRHYFEADLAAGTYYLGVFTSSTKNSGTFITFVRGDHPGCSTHERNCIVTTPATCSAEGVATYTCICGEIWTEAIPTEAEAHCWDEGTVLTAASCTQDGLTHYTCQECGAEEDRVIPADHAWGDPIYYYQPGPKQNAAVYYTCTLCDEMTEPRWVYGSGWYMDFIDVAEGSYCEIPVIWAANQGITTGITDYTFAPGAACSRGQVVTFLWRAAGSPEPKSGVNPFKDVVEGSYCYKAVLWAVENGITNGIDAAHFAPNEPCSRGQVVTFLWRANGQEAPSSAEHAFEDVSETAFYYNAMLWAVENGVTNGIDDTHFAPNDACSRGQVVTFLYRVSEE